MYLKHLGLTAKKTVKKFTIINKDEVVLMTFWK